MLILSASSAEGNRITSELATRYNELVAALADEVCFVHITPAGQAERLTHRLNEWQVPSVALAM